MGEECQGEQYTERSPGDTREAIRMIYKPWDAKVYWQPAEQVIPPWDTQRDCNPANNVTVDKAAYGRGKFHRLKPHSLDLLPAP